VTDGREIAEALATAKAERQEIRDGVRRLIKVVIDGNGTPALMTRVALLEAAALVRTQHATRSVVPASDALTITARGKAILALAAMLGALGGAAPWVTGLIK